MHSFFPISITLHAACHHSHWLPWPPLPFALPVSPLGISIVLCYSKPLMPLAQCLIDMHCSYNRYATVHIPISHTCTLLRRHLEIEVVYQQLVIFGDQYKFAAALALPGPLLRYCSPFFMASDWILQFAAGIYSSLIGDWLWVRHPCCAVGFSQLSACCMGDSCGALDIACGGTSCALVNSNLLDNSPWI